MSTRRFALLCAALACAVAVALPIQSSRAAILYNLSQLTRTVAMYTETGGDIGAQNLSDGVFSEADTDGPYSAYQESDLAGWSISGEGGWSYGENEFPFLLNSTLDATFGVSAASTYTLASTGDVQLLDVTNTLVLGAAGALSPGIEYRLIATAWIGTPEELYFSGPGASDSDDWTVDLQVSKIPAPAASGVLLLGAAVWSRRRRPQ